MSIGKFGLCTTELCLLDVTDDADNGIVHHREEMERWVVAELIRVSNYLLAVILGSVRRCFVSQSLNFIRNPLVAKWQGISMN